MASYTTFPLGDAWPFRDPQTSRHFNLPLFVIHIFRMPAFFAMAGFFAALLHQRGGLRTLLVNRTRRVLLPLVVFWFALAPFMAGAFLFAIHQSTGTPVRAIVEAGSRNTPVTTMHLWFLYYLVIFYAVAAAVLVAARGRSLRADVCSAVTTSAWSVPLWSTVTALTLLPMEFPGIEGSTRLLPPVRTLVAYGVFFVFGWLLFAARRDIQRLGRSMGWHLALGVFGVAGYVYVELRPLADPLATHSAACIAMAASMWGFVFGITGAFLRVASGEHPAVQYLSKAAYWTYLVHLPIVVFTAGALARTPLHAFVKFSIVLTVTTVTCLATYHYFVRTTVIGALLNGTRQPVPGRPRPRSVEAAGS
jgi:peptidoglycan/LPS O-acetylase OafA/YrhL